MDNAYLPFDSNENGDDSEMVVCVRGVSGPMEDQVLYAAVVTSPPAVYHSLVFDKVIVATALRALRVEQAFVENKGCGLRKNCPWLMLTCVVLAQRRACLIGWLSGSPGRHPRR